MKNKKKLLTSIAVACGVLVLLCGAIVAFKMTGVFQKAKVDVEWYEEEGKEFLITTAEELRGIAKLSEKHDFKGQTIKLGADIVLNEGDYNDWKQNYLKCVWKPIEGFAGTFDGQGHTISGLYCVANGYKVIKKDVVWNPSGMFNSSTDDAVIRDFRIVNSYYSSSNKGGIGSVIGRGNGTVESVYSNATIVTTKGVNGGMVGEVQASGSLTIRDCQFDGEIQMVGDDAIYTGGIVGYVNSSAGTNTIEHCLFTGTITSDKKDGQLDSGGIVGVTVAKSRVVISDCLFAGTIDVAWKRHVGSIVGYHAGALVKMTNVYSDAAGYAATIGVKYGKFDGYPIELVSDCFKGNHALQWTELDFDKYWTVVEEGTPMLRTFADKVVDSEEMQKAYDTAWYDSKESTYTISTLDEWYGFYVMSAKTKFEGKTIYLGADISFDGKPYYPIQEFAGTFDGKGHTISGIDLKTCQRDAGLFTRTATTAVLKDFRLTNSYFECTADGIAIMGSIVGYADGRLDTIYSNAVVVADALICGGLVGNVVSRERANIVNCWYDGEMRIGDNGGYIGGIAGQVEDGSHAKIMHCLYSGKITGTKEEGSMTIGGMVGVISDDYTNVTISDCLNAGFITTPTGSGVGTMASTILPKTTLTLENCYAIKESTKTAYVTASEHGTKVNEGYTRYTADLVGYKAYEFTLLDFDKYWAVNKKGTPILQSFAENIPSLAGHKRKIDITWYKEDAKQYVLKTMEELYGLYHMSFITNFEGKTVRLGADITVNTGTASDWQASAPANPWYPIQKFAGTFDGKGHTINGIYLKTDIQGSGFFAATTPKSVLKNFKLCNSYFESTSEKPAILGSVVGKGEGRFDTIYTDAHIVANALICGGVVGNVSSKEPVTITNCWFDGVMTLGDNGGYIGGITSQVEDGSVAEITHCLYTGTITGTKEKGSMTMGGMVGVISDDNTKVTVSDCLNAGYITTPTGGGVGTMASTILPKTTLILNNCYAIKESSKTSYVTASEHGTKVNEGYTRYAADLAGYKAYEFTLLDFDKYWAVVEEGTPILKSFAKAVPSLAGHKRKIDIAWYKEDAKQYVIKTMEELYGLYHMSFITSFEGKTVRLGADITVNSGAASDWQENAPANPWYSIQKFAGTFDGKGHTINGIYLKTDIQGSGFFAATTPKSVLKNFKLCNSYFESTSERPAVLGSVVGRGEGRFDTIYTDAHIVANALVCGGIVGNVSSKEPTTITNCWFDGVMTLGDNGGYIGGITSQVEDGSVAEITHCLYTGTITGTKEKGSMTMGGMVGVISDDNTKVTVSDCLNAGYITTPTGGGVGTMASTILPNTTLILNNCYAIKESTKTSYVTASEHGTKVNEGYTRYAADFAGYKAYEFTLLDFDKYWAVVEDGTPILKSFAKAVPSLAGHKRKIDIAWYKEDAKQYVIKTMEELYGLYHMSFITSFEGKTVRLGADITVNSGAASDWQENAPANPWYPIQKFAGTFDGKGHTINGIYLKTDIQGSGFFAATTPKSVLKNFKLCNSYFESTSERPAILGSVVGKGEGRFDTIYTDAHIVANALVCGGIVGNVSSKEPVTITNCWFDGVMTLGDNGGYIGGITSQVEDGTIAEITHCLNSGTISGTKEKGSMTMGGIVGVISDAGTKVRIVDSLNVGNITSPTGGGIGTMVSTILKDTVVTLDNCYAASDSTKFGNVCASKHGTLEGSCTQQPKSGLRGYNAYYVTYLDFKDYWAVNLEGTPILQSFAKTIPSLAGIEKMNMAWYNENKTEFVLNTVAELYGWSELSKTIDFEGKTIKLGKDIVLNEGNAADWSKKAPGSSWYPIQNFAGTFDGQGYTISGVYYSNPQSTGYGYGLFTETKDGAVVKNFSLKNSYICANLVVGSIAGKPRGTFENIYSDAIVESTGQFAGGLFGSLETGEGQTTTITNCWFDGSVHSSVGNAGGIIGYVKAETSKNNILSNCLVTGTVSSNGRYVGGLCGQICNGTPMLFEKCLADATLSGEAYVGGIIGLLDEPRSADSKSIINDVYTTANTGIVYGAARFASLFKDVDVAGDNGFVNTMLDFETYWTTVDGGTPELRTFAEKVQEAPKVNKKLVASMDWAFEVAGTEEDPYLLKDAADLLGFAQNPWKLDFDGKVIKLQNDITFNVDINNATNRTLWTNIGSTADPFNATFDGQGYTIRGIYYQSTEGTYNHGFFGETTDNAVVKNFSLKDSKFIATLVTGSIAAKPKGRFENIYSSADVETSGQFTGGLFGSLEGTGNTTTIENCWFDGTVTSTGGNAGGIAGIVDKAGKKVISNCLVTGSVVSSSSDVGGLIGRVTNGTPLLLSNSISAPKTLSGTSYVGGGIGIVDQTSNKTVIINDVYTTESTGVVYGNMQYGAVSVDVDLIGDNGFVNTMLDFDKYWTTVDGGTPELRTFAKKEQTAPNKNRKIVVSLDWACDVAGTESDPYLLEDAADLLGFAQNPWNLNFDGKIVKLKNDITFNVDIDSATNRILWTNIGTSSKPFNGTFDGQGYTISGIYYQNTTNTYTHGFFGALGTSALIQNFSLEDSYIEGKDVTGAIAGKPNGTFKNIYTDATVKGARWVGGFFGSVESTATLTVENCMFAGEVVATGISTGGLAGQIASGVTADVFIKNCLITGSVTNSDARVGGLIGTNASTKLVQIENCLADVSKLQGSNYIGGIAGVLESTSNTQIVGKVYANREGIGSGNLTSGNIILFDNNALSQTKFDLPTEYWTMIPDCTPILSTFNEENDN